MDIETLAQRANVKPDTLRAWEEGDALPTFRQAQQLAHRLNVPCGYLFLSSPPVLDLPIPDLRTFANERPRKASPEFTDLLNDVLTKQQWFREYQQSEGVEPLSFVGRYHLNDSVETIAADIRGTLDIDDDMRKAAPNWEGFLREFIRRTEHTGIMVLRSGVVENNPYRTLAVSEFRGFAISDEIAPLIFIKGRDYKAAQIFTLAHEIAHLWIGESGVSNPDYRVRSIDQNNVVESFCNRIGAETLVPADDFRTKWQDGTTNIETNLQVLAARYRVSSMVVLRQAYDLDIIPSDTYWSFYDNLVATHREASKTSDGGGNFYATLLARNSSTLTTAIISGIAEGNVLRREAAKLLNVRVNTLSGIAKYLFGDRPPIG